MKKILKFYSPTCGPCKVVSKNLSYADQSFKLTKDAMFSVWIDALILVFIVLMFVLILYGYVMSA